MPAAAPLTSAAVSALAVELRSDPAKKANNVTKLLPALTPGAAQEAAQREAIRALKHYFLQALDEQRAGRTGKAQPAGDAAQIFAGWLQRQYAACTARLSALLQSPEVSGAVQVEALVAVMEFVRGEAAGEFQNELYVEVLAGVLRSAAFSSVFLGALSNKYLKFADVRYYTLKALQRVARRLSAPSASGDASSGEEDEAAGAEGGARRGAAAASAPDVARNCFDLLALVPASLGAASNKPLSREEQLLAALTGAAGGGAAPKLLSWCGAAETNLVTGAKGKADSAKERRKRKRAEGGAGPPLEARQWANPKLQRQAYSKAWLAFLQMSLPDDIYKKVLEQLHATVIPNLSNPLLLSDFLSASLDKEGLTAILALNGIFILVTKHGLEYPHFFRRLYGLLTPEVFKSKHRVQFFKLADLFLASALVPAYTVAAFIKRFARIALVTTPPGAMTAMAFIHNLIRRHPSCFVLLHRPGAPEGSEAGADPFAEECEDPAESRAIESSLWEVASLAGHYNPSVAEMARMLLEKDMTDRRKTAELNIGLFSKESYTSMIDAELKRRLKRVPVAFYASQPQRLFDDTCVAGFPGWSFE